METLGVTRIRVAVDGGDADGLLVLHDGALVAVLASLTGDFYGADDGRWYLEAAFGRCAGRAPTFATLDAALHTLAARLGLDEQSATAAIARLDGA